MYTCNNCQKREKRKKLAVCTDCWIKQPTADFIKCRTLTPNMITVLGLGVTLLIVYLLRTKTNIVVIALLAAFRAWLDVADGAVARNCGMTSDDGALFDILSDTVLTAGIAIQMLGLYSKTDVAAYNNGPGAGAMTALWVAAAAISSTELAKEYTIPEDRSDTRLELFLQNNSLILTTAGIIGAKLALSY
jgi:hypothetical protein